MRCASASSRVAIAAKRSIGAGLLCPVLGPCRHDRRLFAVAVFAVRSGSTTTRFQQTPIRVDVRPSRFELGRGVEAISKTAESCLTYHKAVSESLLHLAIFGFGPSLGARANWPR